MNNPANTISEYEAAFDRVNILLDRFLDKNNSLKYETMSDEVASDLIANVSKAIYDLNYSVRVHVTKDFLWYMIYSHDLRVPNSHFYRNVRGKRLHHVATSKLSLKYRRAVASQLEQFLMLIITITPDSGVVIESLVPHSF